LFISIRSGASVCQDLAVSPVPRAALTGRAPVVKSAGAMVAPFRLKEKIGLKFCIN
jgi:hypothetical protein